MTTEDSILKVASHGEFKPYTMSIVGNYSGYSMPWFGIHTHGVEIWGLFYDETEIMRGGKTSVERMLFIANGAYNSGVIGCLSMLNLK